MRKLLDINVCLALFIAGHSQHAVADEWYENAKIAKGDVLFCRQTELGFLRLLTQQRVMEPCGRNAFTNQEASELLEQIQSRPAISVVNEVSGTRNLWLALASQNQASPNLWMDAYLAALAITNNVEMVTFDQGFTSYNDFGLKLKLL